METKFEVSIFIYRDTEMSDVYTVEIEDANGDITTYGALDSNNVGDICKTEIASLIEKESR